MPLTLHIHLALVTLGEDVLWEEILRGSGIGPSVLRELSPRSVIVEPDAVSGLLDWLRRAGHLPKVIP